MDLFHLLIVDDEPFILDGLRYNIDWNRQCIDQVYTAGDTAEALDILQNHRIDVVITDIQMPGDDGLILGSRILSQYPYTKVIILSGYQNFSYARRSVDIKAFRYLLKPIQYEELEETVAEALEELKADLQKRMSLQTAKAQMEEAAPILQRHFLSRWLEKDVVRPWEDGVEQLPCGVPVKREDVSFLIMLRIDQEGVSREEENHLAVLELCRSILAEDHRMFDYLNSQGNHCFFFCSEDGPETREFFNRAVERLEVFLSALENFMSAPIRIFYSGLHPVEDLGRVYRELNRKMLRYLVNSRNIIYNAEEVSDSGHKELQALHRHPTLATLVANCRKEAAMEWIDAVFDELAEKEQNGQEYLQVYHLIIGVVISDSLQRQIEISQWDSEFSGFIENAGTDSCEELRSKCTALVSCYMEYLARWQGSQEKRLVKDIREKIDAHVGEPLSVSVLASYYSYNPTYLSRVFKDETGQPLQDYIIGVKMERAKLLLSEGMPAGEVMLSVGYENYPHFSRAFKKYVGVSPKQYSTRS